RQRESHTHRTARLCRPARRHSGAGGCNAFPSRAILSSMPDHILPTSLVELAERVIAANRRAGRTGAVAESCTGGLVSAALTEIAGSSDVFEAGFITYSNEMKTDLLKVSPDVLDTFGAV